MATEDASFDHLGPAGAAAGRMSAAPRRIVFATLGLAVLLSWLLLVLMAASASQRALLPHESSPGAELLRLLPDLALPSLVERLVALCLSPAAAAPSLPAYAGLWLMWMLMSLAMMLPSAAPLVRTYCEIADTASARGVRAVHPLILVAGYLAVWALASAAFAALALGVQAVAANSAAAPVTGVAGAAALAIAGLYQFSGLKEACLEKCRNPFGVLFANWSDRRPAIFRLGLRQGLWCLGCCWALMLVMFAVGVMNVFWMALIGVFALVEKEGRGPLATRAAGTILLVWACALLLVTLWFGESAYA